jgi:predicted Zn-dependent protease
MTLRTAALAVLLALPLGTSAAPADPLRLPDLGSPTDTLLSTAEKRALGQAFMRYVRRMLPVSDDAVLTDYIESLGRQIVRAGGDNTGNFDFFVVEQPAVNAFAGPSGHIGVFSGLILASETEAELAAVIAHEVAHVSQDHLMRGFDDQRKMALPATALLIAAAVLGAQVDAEVAQAAIAGVQAAAVQRRINFTRANEEEADRIGMATLAAAGFDPFAMPGFFQKLARSTRIYETDAPEFLRTHPVTTTRIADALGRATQLGARQRPDSLRFHLARANLRQRSHNRAEKAVDEFKDRLAGGRYRNEAAEHYGYALALARAGRLGDALAEVERLLETHPSQMELLVLKADILRRAGKPDRAIQDLKGAVGLSPSSWPLRQAYAQALLAAGRADEALRTLEGVTAYHSDTASLFSLMADVAGKAGKPGLYARYRAEYLYLQGDLEPAIRQLEAGLRQPDLDFPTAAKLKVRLEELREALLAEKKNPWR